MGEAVWGGAEGVLAESTFESRKAAVKNMSRRDFASLYAWAKQQNQIPTAYGIVAANVPDHHVVSYWGYNTLWGVRSFYKNMFRENNEVYGYNQHPFAFFTGPGYFMVRCAQNTCVFDYGVLPLKAPQSGPALKNNTQGLRRVVYGGLTDAVYGVSEGVLIGKVAKYGVEQENYFILVRQ